MEDFENDGEVDVASMSELGIGENDSWKGVEGCVEAVLSAIVRLLCVCASPDASRKLWQVSEKEADFYCT
jgi:hypothetical protein